MNPIDKISMRKARMGVTYGILPRDMPFGGMKLESLPRLNGCCMQSITNILRGLFISNHPIYEVGKVPEKPMLSTKYLFITPLTKK